MEIPSKVTQSTCHSCLHLEQSIFEMFGIDLPQGQRSVPLCDILKGSFDSSDTLMSASGVAVGSMAGAGAVVFSMVSDVLMLLFRRSGRVVCGCWEDCLVFGLLDDCLGFADAFGCVFVAILAVTLVFGRETGFVV